MKVNMLKAIEISQTSKHDCELTITVENSTVCEEYERTLNRVQSFASRPGFRKGKMPKNMVENFYNKQIKEELIDKLIDKSFEMACKKESLTPISRPKLSVVNEPDRKNPFTYKAAFQIKPSIENIEYSGLSINLKKVIISDKDIDLELKELQKDHAMYVDPQRDTIGENDMVYANEVSKIGENIFEEDLKDEQLFPLFDPMVPKAVREIFLGKKAGDNLLIDDSLFDQGTQSDPDTKKNESLLRINSFKERRLPNLDDEFAKDISDKFANLAELKSVLNENLSELAESRNVILRENAILDALVLKNPISVPSSMVDNKAWSLINDLFLKGLSKEEAKASLKNHYEKMRKIVDERASNYVKAQLLFEHLIEKLAISVTDEKVSELLKKNPKIGREDALFSLQVKELINIIEKQGNITIVEEPLVNENAFDDNRS